MYLTLNPTLTLRKYDNSVRERHKRLSMMDTGWFPLWLTERGAHASEIRIVFWRKRPRLPSAKFWLAVSENGLVAVEWGLTRDEFEAYLIKRFKRSVQPDPERILEPARQIDEYLSGLQRLFTLPIDWTVPAALPAGRTPGPLAKIPYGETRTYKGNCRAHRPGRTPPAPLARAEATNPMPLVPPLPPRHRCRWENCMAMAWRKASKPKQWLLRMEGAVIA